MEHLTKTHEATLLQLGPYIEFVAAFELHRTRALHGGVSEERFTELMTQANTKAMTVGRPSLYWLDTFVTGELRHAS